MIKRKDSDATVFKRDKWFELIFFVPFCNRMGVFYDFFGPYYGAKTHGMDELANSRLKSAATLEREVQ